MQTVRSWEQGEELIAYLGSPQSQKVTFGNSC